MPQPHAPAGPVSRPGGPPASRRCASTTWRSCSGQVADAGRASRARIAASTGLTKASVSSLVETLLEAHLVARGGLATPRASAAPAPRWPWHPRARWASASRSTSTTSRPRWSTSRARSAPARVSSANCAASLCRRCSTGPPASCAGPWRVRGRAARSRPGRGRRGRRPGPGRDRRGRGPGRAEPRLAGGAAAGGAAGAGGPARRSRADARQRGQPGRPGRAVARRPPRGPGRPLDTFVHVSGEVGVGAGIVLHGELLRGRHGFAGEIGHLPVPGSAAPCGCGASGLPGAGRRAGRDRPRRRGPARGGRAAPRGRRGRRGRRPRRPAGRRGGRGRRRRAWAPPWPASCNLLDVDTVVLGGGYARLAPWLAPAVTAQLRSRVLAVGAREVRVLTSRLGAQAAVLGAAESVVRGRPRRPGRAPRRRRSRSRSR